MAWVWVGHQRDAVWRDPSVVLAQMGTGYGKAKKSASAAVVAVVDNSTNTVTLHAVRTLRETTNLTGSHSVLVSRVAHGTGATLEVPGSKKQDPSASATRKSLERRC